LTMEASLHETGGDTVFGPNSVFARLGLSDAMQPIETEVFYEARGGPLPAPVQIPRGLDNAHASSSQALPGLSVAIHGGLGLISGPDKASALTGN